MKSPQKCDSCSLQSISEFSKQWAFQQEVGREASRDPFQPKLLYNYITKNQLLQNQKQLLQKAQICFNDIALYYCKADKANINNLRVRKYNIQLYTAPSTSSDVNSPRIYTKISV